MTAIAAVFLLVFLAWALAPRDAGRPWVDGLVYAGLLAVGAWVSLLAFDSIDNHAFRAHEEQLFALFSGTAPPEGYHPAEVQVLIGWIYGLVGAVVGRSMTVFVVTAYLLGGLGILFAGLTVRHLTGSRGAGFLAAALLVLHPTLAYWRVHGFHVAPAHAAFCACLYAAVRVAERPTRRRFTLWFGLGALTAFVRLEYGLAVAMTAAVPLLGGASSSLKQWRLWVPPLAVFAVLLVAHQVSMVRLLAEREDYRLGLRFLWLHLPLTAPWRPVTSLGGLVGVGLAGVALSGRFGPRTRGQVAGLLLVAAGGMLPLLFMDFGGRHLLPATTAALAVGVVGVDALARVDRRLAWALGFALCVGLASASVADLRSLSPRYGDQSVKPPQVAGVARPEGELPPNWRDCAIYTNAMGICETSPNCHPLKDLRDPALVAQRWDDFDGCVLWGVEAGLDDVAGAQHEAWPVLQRLYPLTPVAEVDMPRQGERIPSVLVYRIAERPRGPGMKPKGAVEEEFLPDP